MIRNTKTSTSLAQQVGKEIAMRRKKLGYTQVQVAQMLGIEQESLSRMEKGIIAPKFSRLESLAKVLECTVIDLFRRDNDTVENVSTYISQSLSNLTKKQQKVALEAMEGIMLAFRKYA